MGSFAPSEAVFPICCYPRLAPRAALFNRFAALDFAAPYA